MPHFFSSNTAKQFDQLKLELTEEAMQQAWKERITQVSGTNQHSLGHLWQAYISGDANNKLGLINRAILEGLANGLRC